METFSKLFGGLLVLVYHCFDRVVIQGYLPLLTRPEHIVHFFRDVHGIAPITKEVLIQRTTEYKAWVEAFARDHGVPIAWAEPGVKKEDHVRPYLERIPCFRVGRTNQLHSARRLKRPTIKPMLRFKSSSTCSQHETLREKFSESAG
jgi:hypothetical protein